MAAFAAHQAAEKACKALHLALGCPVPMDVTVCTRGELARELAAGNRFVRRMLGESIVLYARDERLSQNWLTPTGLVQSTLGRYSIPRSSFR